MLTGALIDELLGAREIQPHKRRLDKIADLSLANVGARIAGAEEADGWKPRLEQRGLLGVAALRRATKFRQPVSSCRGW